MATGEHGRARMEEKATVGQIMRRQSDGWLIFKVVYSVTAAWTGIGGKTDEK